MEERKKIIVGFSRIRDPGCWDSQEFDRVEILFSDGFVTFVNETHVQYIQREATYYRAQFEIMVESEIEMELQAYACACWQQKIQYNRIAEFWNFMPLLNWYPVMNNGNTYFGAEYICSILQKAYFCPELLAATTDPDKLFQSLKNDNRINLINNN